jgi:ferredoxin-NADP reductase
MATTTMVIHGGSNVTTTMSKSTDWRVATVQQIRVEAPGLRTYNFRFDEPVCHDSGQHYEIRLVAEDGYEAARLYSAASPADGSSNILQLTVGLMPYGELSPYIFRQVTSGTQLELRGPFGRHFIWTPKQTEPVLLIGGGTGVIPLRAMRREHQQAKTSSPMTLLYSARSYHDMAYKYELMPDGKTPAKDVIMTFSDMSPEGWTGYARQIDRAMIGEVLQRFNAPPQCYVCGPTPMVEAVTQLLVQAGIDPARIKAERFGATG